MLAPALLLGLLLGQAEVPREFALGGGAANEHPSFMIRVAVDKTDRVYSEGDVMTVSVVPERDCHVYLVYYDAQDNIVCLFPNRFQRENFVSAGSKLTLPSPDADFRFQARPPFGEEVLQVVATLHPVDLFDEKDLKLSRFTALSLGDVRKAFGSVKAQRDPASWAEARIKITTRPAVAPPEPEKVKPAPTPTPAPPPTPAKLAKRIAICVGISEYRDKDVPQLRVSHTDAQRMAEALRQKCGVSEVKLLVNEQATGEAIRQAIFEDAPRMTSPGDTVFLFFSGHGGRTQDHNGDEADGLDEYLVPHDGTMGDPDTMILDDQFARWVRELDGRKVCILLDNCYSGGSARSMKGLRQPARIAVASSPSVDFFDGELRRTKDLGQSDTEILAASQADQVAWEMPGNDGSVLTYHLLKAIDDPACDANQDKQLSVAEVYRYVKDSVQSYVVDQFQTLQIPVLVDNANDSIILRP